MGIIDRMRLDGKAIFVTGGARGIGKSVSTAFAEAGANLAIVDIDINEARKTAEKLEAENGIKAIAIQTDVTKPDQVDDMVKEVVKTFGKLDVAFCNAGICIHEPAEEMSYESWMKVIDVNLNGVFLTNQAAGKVMIKQGGGSIINTASMSATIVNYPQPQCAYNPSKAGVVSLTKCLAVEWADKNVRVNSISPGYIETELIFEAKHLVPLIEKWNAATPLRRMGKPEELQAICLYLAGDTSTYTTGSDFIIDGGFTCI